MPLCIGHRNRRGKSGRLQALLPFGVHFVQRGHGVCQQGLKDGVRQLHLDGELVVVVVDPVRLLLLQLLHQHSVHVVLLLAHVPLVGRLAPVPPRAAVEPQDVSDGGLHHGHQPVHGAGGAVAFEEALPLLRGFLPGGRLQVVLMLVDVPDDVACQVKYKPPERAPAAQHHALHLLSSTPWGRVLAQVLRGRGGGLP